jgi:hypothetical protein
MLFVNCKVAVDCTVHCQANFFGQNRTLELRLRARLRKAPIPLKRG